MKGLVLLLVKIMLLITAVCSILYFLNIPVTEIAGERIGFADLANFFFYQTPPQLPEVNVGNNTEIASWAEKMDGSDLGESAEILGRLGNPIRFCIFKDYNYCQNFRIDGGKMYETADAAQKTVYVSYHLALEIKTMAELQNYQDLETILIKGIKKGEIKGLTIGDVMNMGK